MDGRAFARFFEEVYPALRGYCVRLTGNGDVSSDVAQEAFVRLAKNNVTGEAPALRVWLYKVATHLIRDRHRVESNRTRLLAENPILDNRADSPDTQFERKQTRILVRSVLKTLQPRDREMLLMRHGGFSYREIAEVLEVAPASVGTLLARAQRRFAEKLKGTSLEHRASAQKEEAHD